MKNSARRKTGTPEYKHSTRKKYLAQDVSEKEWAQIQKKNLPAFRGLDYGEWPVDKILNERRLGTENKRLEYLVQWQEHPIKKASWKPEWVCSRSHSRLCALTDGICSYRRD